MWRSVKLERVIATIRYDSQASHSKKTRTAHLQFLRYFFVGGTAAVVDLLVYAVLVKYGEVHYISAAFLAYMAGLSWNHLLCVFWVFDSKHHRFKELLMVFFIAVGGILCTWLILYLLIDLAGLDPVIAKMISQVLVLFWNFSMRKFYVFQ